MAKVILLILLKVLLFPVKLAVLIIAANIINSTH